jgi:uncharacterized protein (TIGR02246 family)
MKSQTSHTQDMPPAEASEIRALYHRLLECWNKRNADDYAALFVEDSNVVGFDGSQVNGRTEIAAHLRQIFADHQTSAYIGKIREARFLAPEVALLHAVSGMVPPGKSELDPAVNTIQTLIAVRAAGNWRIALFQSTPAQFHGRPELAQALTEELRQLL